MSLVLFMHLPRTAGTTFVQILERQYGPNGVLRAYDVAPGAAWRALPDERRSEIRAVVGHFAYGAHEGLPPGSRYLSFLRDPVERVVSHYRYVRAQPDHYLHESATGLTLAEYVESCGANEPNNDQTRLWAGAEHGACSPELLPVAKANLEGAVIGLTAEFDASVMLIRRLLGWRLPLYVPRNAAGRRSPVPGLDADVRELILARNALDLELYAFAAERFENRVREAGRRFGRDVSAFRALNALYRGFHRSRSLAGDGGIALRPA